jgi:hypothetical protein
VATDASLVVLGLGIVFLPYALWQARLRVRRRWNAFELSIGPTNMRCAARGAGRVTLPLDGITSITEGSSGLVVHAAASSSRIHIPRTVEGFVDVRQRLAHRWPIGARADALGWCLTLVVTGLLATATVPLWGRAGCVAAGVLAAQTAAAYAAAAEIRWHPRLSRSIKLLALAVLAVATLLPPLGLFAHEITS